MPVSTITMPATRRRVVALSLLAALVGFALRGGVLAVPPILDVLGGSLNLNHSAEGLLTSLPVLCFGVAAIPGAGLVRRLGGKRTVTLGLAAVTVGSALRGLPLGDGMAPLPLFGGTVIVGLGIGICQPALPRILRFWDHRAVQRFLVLVTVGYIVGQLAGASLSRPLLGGAGGSWRIALLVWTLAPAAALAWWLKQPGDRPDTAVPERRTSFAPLLRSRMLWVVAITMACTNLAFFTSNAWISLSAPGGPGSPGTASDLFALNAASLPVAMAATALGGFARRRLTYVVSGLCVLFGALGWIVARDAGVIWMTLIGGGGTLAFAGIVAYPASLGDTSAIAPFSALAWTVGCAAAFLGPLLGGIAVDLTGWTAAPFLAIAVAGAVMVIATAFFSPPAVPAAAVEPARIA